MGRVVHTLRAAVEQLQRDAHEQLALEQESASTFSYVCQQVAALQKGFSALADATVEELERARREREEEREEELAWREEQMRWRAGVEAAQQELHRTLTGACHWQADAQGVLEAAAADANAAKDEAEAAHTAAENAQASAAVARAFLEQVGL